MSDKQNQLESTIAQCDKKIEKLETDIKNLERSIDDGHEDLRRLEVSRTMIYEEIYDIQARGEKLTEETVSYNFGPSFTEGYKDIADNYRRRAADRLSAIEFSLRKNIAHTEDELHHKKRELYYVNEKMDALKREAVRRSLEEEG